MAYSTTSQGDTINYDVRDFVCDTIQDIDTLPKDCASGSTAFVIANKTVWMLGNDKQWHQI